MKTKIKALFADKQIRRFTWINISILITFIVFFIWKWPALPSQLPLYYSLPRSTDQLGIPIQLSILPLFSIIFSVINFYLASLLYLQERLAAKILVIMAATVSFLCLVTFMKIIFLVT